jgi:hypothetical protein
MLTVFYRPKEHVRQPCSFLIVLQWLLSLIAVILQWLFPFSILMAYSLFLLLVQWIQWLASLIVVVLQRSSMVRLIVVVPLWLIPCSTSFGSVRRSKVVVIKELLRQPCRFFLFLQLVIYHFVTIVFGIHS